MDLRIGSTAGPLQSLQGKRHAATPASGQFANTLDHALRAVSQTQQQAEKLQMEVQADNPAVSLEQTMLAIQKAQIGFQAAVHVRNRMVQAYTDIMNMQV